ncbi:MAG: phosphohydrolase, partial [Firmicutes bacterium]|nr:phosphohydrolase [Bacillota bacterium]
MQFVKVDDLKPGMRLARPIYNKNGVLLYERDTKIPIQGIYSIKNFGLLGLYILEPAEPLPPMSEEDVEFERFQTMSIFTLRDELKLIINKKEPKNLGKLVDTILRNYGSKRNKINFLQNLRSQEDYVYKYSLNVGILCALMSSKMKMGIKDQMDLINAAVLHAVGRMLLPEALSMKFDDYTEEEEKIVDKCNRDAYDLLKVSSEVKQIIMQANRRYEDISVLKLTKAAKILQVAIAYDVMTAMKVETEPTSEISAIRTLIIESKKYDRDCVDALIASINIISPGVSVELSNGEKGLVIRENEKDILEPMVLGFSNNK